MSSASGGCGRPVAPLLVGGFVVFVFATEYTPESKQAAPVEGKGDGSVYGFGEPFKVLWNLQYSASRKHRFFYDGGDAVHVPEADVQARCRPSDPYWLTSPPRLRFCRKSTATQRVSGPGRPKPSFVEGMKATAWAAAPYHKAAFVPKPFARIRPGRVQMDLGILTTGPLQSAERHRNALMNEPRPVQALNLKQALLTAEVPVQGLSQPLPSQ